MSADNYWFVTKHPDGGFTYVMGFDSNEEKPGVWEHLVSRLPRFDFVSEAISAAAADGYTEYGVQIDDEILHASDVLEAPFDGTDHLIDVLQGLAPDAPMNQDEQGGCVWCGSHGNEGSYGYAGPSFLEHDDDCAWVAGRKLLDALRG